MNSQTKRGGAPAAPLLFLFDWDHPSPMIPYFMIVTVPL